MSDTIKAAIITATATLFVGFISILRKQRKEKQTVPDKKTSGAFGPGDIPPPSQFPPDDPRNPNFF
ncbi:MAG TPA: hypothetical protein VFC85_08190 [Verrucomicrobiae bacterium]|nr:hypothetical protein [Verrucomicrobiae bacterium]